MANLSTNIAGLELKNPFIAASSDNTRDIRQLRRAEECGASAFIVKALLPANSIELKSTLRVFVDAKGRNVYGTAGANRLSYDQGADLVRTAKKESRMAIDSQRSPGSADAITGWPLSWACFVACRLGELSQHSVTPHS